MPHGIKLKLSYKVINYNTGTCVELNFLYRFAQLSSSWTNFCNVILLAEPALKPSNTLSRKAKSFCIPLGNQY